ncbi:MAG: HlyD family efflux transporter periplasmic adaptor subunit [Myxococcales bacterium]|nr:HlyD family efflux transporter periplasmic adaptor subunit [Myxococcales bacterium]
MSKLRNVLRAALPLVVLVVSAFFANWLFNEQPQPRKKPRDDRGMLVEVLKVRPARHNVVVDVSGTTTAAYEMDLAAEISGRVIWKNPELTTGGLVREGEPLLKIDPRDYKIALEQQQAAVERARAEMEIELGRKAVAEREWQLFGEKVEGSSKLATREPQLRSVELGVRTAESSRAQAKLRLDRATLRAPFNAVVRTNMTEEGTMVAAGAPLARIVGTDVFMVVASLPVEDLAWLKVPGVNVPVAARSELRKALSADDPDAALASLTTVVRVRQEAGGNHIERSGFITRLLGDLDPAGRMARVLIAVIDPMGLKRRDKPAGVAGLPLLLGAYVNVELFGGSIDDAYELPRLALRDGDKVYLVNARDRLEIRPVVVVRRRAESVLVKGGLQPGERVITSAVPSPLSGMELRVAQPVRAARGGVKTATKHDSDGEATGSAAAKGRSRPREAVQ